MTTLGEDEIDQALEFIVWPEQDYLPYVQYLSDWKDIINQNSDGWSYWHSGRKASLRLMTLVADLMTWMRYGGDAPHRLPQLGKPTLKAFQAALTPIKSFATRHNLPKPTLKIPKEVQK